jgi:hypothetical protein
MTKLVYRDGENIKVLWGNQIGEDSFFIEFITNDHNIFKINKAAIISIKDSEGEQQ